MNCINNLYGIAHVPSNGYVCIKSHNPKLLLSMLDEDNVLVKWDEEYNLWLRVDLTEVCNKPKFALIQGGI